MFRCEDFLKEDLFKLKHFSITKVQILVFAILNIVWTTKSTGNMNYAYHTIKETISKKSLNLVYKGENIHLQSLPLIQ